MSRPVTRSMARKKKQEEDLKKEKGIIKTIEDVLEKTKDNLENLIRGVKPADKPTVVPDDFEDFDEAYDKQDEWGMGEGSDWEDMDEEDGKDKAIEDAMMDDLAMDDLKLRF